MKKLFYLIGALVSAAAVFALIAVLLKKLKVSLSIEGLEDEDNDICDCCDDDDITVTIHPDEQAEDEVEINVACEDKPEEDINPQIEKEIEDAPEAEKKSRKSSK